MLFVSVLSSKTNIEYLFILSEIRFPETFLAVLFAATKSLFMDFRQIYVYFLNYTTSINKSAYSVSSSNHLLKSEICSNYVQKFSSLLMGTNPCSLLTAINTVKNHNHCLLNHTKHVNTVTITC